jgi:hypothetical protein
MGFHIGTLVSNYKHNIPEWLIPDQQETVGTTSTSFTHKYQVPMGGELATLVIREADQLVHYSFQQETLWDPPRQVSILIWSQFKPSSPMLKLVEPGTQGKWWSLPCPYVATVVYYPQSHIVIPLEECSSLSAAHVWSGTTVNRYVQSPRPTGSDVDSSLDTATQLFTVQGHTADFWGQRWFSSMAEAEKRVPRSSLYVQK